MNIHLEGNILELQERWVRRLSIGKDQFVYFRQEERSEEGRKGGALAMSFLKALDPHPALLVVRAVVTLENTSGLPFGKELLKHFNLVTL